MSVVKRGGNGGGMSISETKNPEKGLNEIRLCLFILFYWNREGERMSFTSYKITKRETQNTLFRRTLRNI